MIVEDHDMSDCLATYGYKLRPDREASLLSSRFGIRQPVGSNPHLSLSQAFEDRHFTRREITFRTLNSSPEDSGPLRLD
jgi:hypothetical protein